MDIENFNANIKYDDEFYDNYILNNKNINKNRYFYNFIKRTFDIISSFLAILLLSPLFIVIAIIIKCQSKGPVFFKQDRVGKNGKVFKCYKFRSMYVTAPHDEATSNLQSPELYITKIGRFIRKTSIDELAQLFNVLSGKMSIIGPRPIIINETNLNDMRKQLGVYTMKPGISGYAQVNGRDDVYYKNKAILDSIYVNKASVILDIKLIFKTITCVLKRDGNKDNK